MRSFLVSIAIVLPAALAAIPKDDGTSVGRTITGFRLPDHQGVHHSLADVKDRRLVVVAFVGTECPLAQQYAPRLVELHREFEAKGVAFFGIVSNEQDGLKEIAAYAKAHRVPFPILKDLGSEVADQFGAQRTPEVFVLDGERKIRYAGRIDDQHGVGYKRPRPTKRYLHDAVEELLAGKPVSKSQVEAVGCFIARSARRKPTGDVTYVKDIAPLLSKRCVSCHQSGDIAPFALTGYRQAAAWAETIREVVNDGRMPPWHADPAHGKFSNDPRLTAAEKELIAAWVRNGTPRGEGAEPPPPARVDGWRIGKPDLIIKLPKPFSVPATGVVDYQYYMIDPGFKEDRWVRASEVRPTARGVVHHAVVFVQPPGLASVIERQGQGFELLAGYGPGVPPRTLAHGQAKFIPAGSMLVFQMHYTPSGVEQSDQTEVGLVFADPREVKKEHRTGLILNLRLRIPPGVKSHRVDAEYVFREDTLLLSMAPHMHLRGKSFRFVAHYPDRRSETLLHVPHWAFEWQHLYDLAEPKLMPEGTRLVCHAEYDNSEHNLANPDPTATVTFGLQTWQEMMVGFFLMAPADQDLSLGGPKVKPLANGDYEATFTYRPARPAQSVHLAGSFNDWSRDAQPLSGPDGTGAYTARVQLKKGTHEYKFIIDGKRWKSDPGHRKQSGVFGNSVLVVGG
jgi:peroxiredoxin/mono/diheme cytochrome c family protein